MDKIGISSKKRVPGLVSKNGLVQSVPESLENLISDSETQRAHNWKKN